jgi:hypothetical protein
MSRHGRLQQKGKVVEVADFFFVFFSHYLAPQAGGVEPCGIGGESTAPLLLEGVCENSQRPIR